MLDAKKVTAAKEVLDKEIKKVALELVTCENSRAVFLAKFLKETDFERDLEHYHQFKELTRRSRESLDKFLDYYAQAMGYVLLLAEEGHHSPQFKDLHRRFQKMEELAHKITKVRRREVKLLERITNQKSALTKFLSLNYLRNSSEWIFKGYIEKEALLLLALVKNALESKGEVDKINILLGEEKKKELAYLAISGLVWLVPLIGTLLSLLSTSLLTWLNSYTKNYKRLERILKIT